MSDTRPNTLKTYTAKERNMYLLGLAGQNITYNIINATLAYYLQFTIFIPAIAVGVMMSVARIWDAINDPMMGVIVDKTRSKWGKCRPYLLFTPLPITIITILCFVNGFYDTSLDSMFTGTNGLVVSWAAVSYILWGMLYTVGDIPIWGITSLMTEDQKSRKNLLSLCRLVAAIAGGAVMLSIQSLCLSLGEAITNKYSLDPAKGEQLGFIIVASVFAIIGGIMFQMAGFFTKERIKSSEKVYSFKESLKIIVKNKPFSQILLSGIFGSPKFVVLICAMPLATYYYASKDPTMTFVYLVLLGGGLFIGQFIAMGFSPKMVDKFEKRIVYNYSNIIIIIPVLMVFALYLSAPQDMAQPVYVAICTVLFAICGFGIGTTTTVQSMMIADCIDYEEYKNGVRPDGVFFSGQSFITKLSSGIASIIASLAYAAVGFSDSAVEEVNRYIDAGNLPRENPEYQPFMMILFFLVTIPTAVGALLSVIPTWKYALSDKEHDKILEELIERRREDTVEEEIL